jgi:sterol desaturase/sphingolipid hydroxylase (fatty acid hydroxylase superfamily)
MWELHKVHHSAEVMVGVTKDRVHPLDEVMNNWWNGVIPGATFGVWLFFLQDPVELTIFGINVYFIRNAVMMMDFVRHTHMKFSYGRWLNAVFICPHYHQLHHSVAQEHWDRNFGLALTLWDWLFGTLVVPKPGEDFVFGLQNREAEEYRSVLRLHWVPIKRILLLIGQTAVSLRCRWTGHAHMASNLASVQMPKKSS